MPRLFQIKFLGLLDTKIQYIFGKALSDALLNRALKYELFKCTISLTPSKLNISIVVVLSQILLGDAYGLCNRRFPTLSKSKKSCCMEWQNCVFSNS